MPRRTRVLFVIGTMSGGGAERQVVEILRLIDRERFEPLLYLATREGELLSTVPTDVPVFAFRDQSGTAETWWTAMARRCRLSPLLRYVHLAGVLRRERIDVVYDRTYRATLDAAGATWLRPTPRLSCCVVDPQPELELHAGGEKFLRVADRAVGLPPRGSGAGELRRIAAAGDRVLSIAARPGRHLPEPDRPGTTRPPGW